MSDADHLFQKLEEARATIARKDKELLEQHKIQEILVAAGFLTREKINEARDILQGLD
jgi:hypothetical protein